LVDFERRAMRSEQHDAAGSIKRTFIDGMTGAGEFQCLHFIGR
jgi:hypothetical protein